MAEPRLKTRFWITALTRRCDLAAIGVAVVARGDPDSGAVLLKLNALDGTCTVLSQVHDAAGGRAWMRATGPAPVAEAEADAYIARQRGRDPDLWVVEIESASPETLVDTQILS